MASRLHKRQRIQHAKLAETSWRDLCRGLFADPDAQDTERGWFEGVVGARVDRAPGGLLPGASGAAMFLWDYVRQLLYDRHADLRDAWNELVQAERNGRRKLIDLIRRHDVGRPQDQEPMDSVARRLWAGNFAAARFALALAIESRPEFVRPCEAFRPGKSLRRDFLRAIGSYYAFWNGQDPSAEQRWRGRRILAELQSFRDEDLSQLAESFGAAWVVAEKALAETLPAREPRRIAFAMLRRAVDWLRIPDCEDREPLRTWILLANDSGGNCARLVLTPVPQWQHAPLAFPDPIRLGLLPVDRAWRAAFDAAAHAFTTCCAPEQHLPRVAWSLEFVSPEVIQRVSQSRSDSRGSLARPCFIRGPSASAAFAAAWAVGGRGQIPRDDVVVAAQVVADGKLRPVGSMPEKLDGSLWQMFLSTFIRQLLICSDESPAVQNWIRSMADRAGQDREGFLQKPSSLREVVDLLAYTPRKRPHRRAWLAAALLGLGGAAATSFPWLRRMLFPPPLAEGECELRLFVSRKGTIVDLPLGQAQPPFYPGDGIRLELAAERPAYFYVFWIDAVGKAAPIWPWKSQDWQDRPASRDRPTTLLKVPEPRLDAPAPLFHLRPDAPGLQMILVLVRRTRLPKDVDLRSLFNGIPAQPFASPWRADAAISIATDGITKIVLEAGADRVVRTPIGDELFQESADDPLRHIQRLVLSRLDGNGDVAMAVGFAFESPAGDSEGDAP